MRLLDIAQHMWRTEEIPQELGWAILVLIPEEVTDTRGIGLLETFCKLVEALIDTRLISIIHFRDVLHGLRDGIDTGTDVMELNIAQDIASVDHDPLFLVFLDLRKSYDTLDRESLIHTLEGYGVGPHMCGLLETFWDHQQVVPR